MVKIIKIELLKISGQISTLQMKHILIHQRFSSNIFYERRAYVISLKIFKKY
jgi:hypothetical protein